jgi:hypothetical protein
MPVSLNLKFAFLAIALTGIFSGISIAQQTRDPIHNAGTKLLETELYVVYRSAPSYSKNGTPIDNFCRMNFGRGLKNNDVRISIVFKVDADYVVTDDEGYRRRFEEKILPLISKECENIKHVFIQNYVYGVRIDHAGQEYRYEQQFPEGYYEDPLNTIHVYIESDEVDRYEGYQTDDMGSRTYASLASLRKTRDKEAAASITREAERKRQAEIERQQKIAGKREADRARAAEVLRYLRKGSPEKYNFSGYEFRDALQNIYDGNFEPFTGGYESEIEYKSKYLGSMLGSLYEKDANAALTSIFSSTAKTLDMVQRRGFVEMAYYAYQNVYAQQCISNKEIPWAISEAYIFYTTRNGIRVPGSERDGIVRPVRHPFKSRYDEIYGNYGKNKNESPTIPQTFLNDFGKFLKVEGCASPAVRQFEVNLYLVAEWLLPVKELQQPNKLENQKPQVEKLQPRLENPKARIRNRKIKARANYNAPQKLDS